jgi:hypothetical protein
MRKYHFLLFPEKSFIKSIKEAEVEIIEPAATSFINETKSDVPRIVIGDLSCMKEDFKPAPPIAHADIKYLR